MSESLDELQELDVLVDDVDRRWPLFLVQWRIRGGGGGGVGSRSPHSVRPDQAG